MGAAILSQFCRQPYELLCLLLTVDTVPHLCPYAARLEDRRFVYAPNPTPGQKPVVVGHVHSLVAFLPERERETTPLWAVFLNARRWRPTRMPSNPGRSGWLCLAPGGTSGRSRQWWGHISSALTRSTGHRFLKRNLPATACQTPEVEHEERWWHIPALAAFQLWLARVMSRPELRPWERYVSWRRGDLREGEALSPAFGQNLGS